MRVSWSCLILLTLMRMHDIYRSRVESNSLGWICFVLHCLPLLSFSCLVPEMTFFMFLIGWNHLSWSTICSTICFLWFGTQFLDPCGWLVCFTVLRFGVPVLSRMSSYTDFAGSPGTPASSHILNVHFRVIEYLPLYIHSYLSVYGCYMLIFNVGGLVFSKTYCPQPTFMQVSKHVLCAPPGTLAWPGLQVATSTLSTVLNRLRFKTHKANWHLADGTERRLVKQTNKWMLCSLLRLARPRQ